MTWYGKPPWGCVALANYQDYSIHNVKYQLANTNWYALDGSLENVWVRNLKNNSGQFLGSTNTSVIVPVAATGIRYGTRVPDSTHPGLNRPQTAR